MSLRIDLVKRADQAHFPRLRSLRSTARSGVSRAGMLVVPAIRVKSVPERALSLVSFEHETTSAKRHPRTSRVAFRRFERGAGFLIENRVLWVIHLFWKVFLPQTESRTLPTTDLAAACSVFEVTSTVSRRLGGRPTLRSPLFTCLIAIRVRAGDPSFGTS